MAADGASLYFGASGHHLRNGRRGDPDLGWVGRYQEPNLSPVDINGLPEHQRQAQRGGNVWTAATFGVFAVRDGAATAKPADFDYLRVSHPKPRVFVLTDIENEPDDAQSMVRLLTYSNQFDIEGLVATSSVHMRNKTAAWRIREIVFGVARRDRELRPTGHDVLPLRLRANPP